MEGFLSRTQREVLCGALAANHSPQGMSRPRQQMLHSGFSRSAPIHHPRGGSTFLPSCVSFSFSNIFSLLGSFSPGFPDLQVSGFQVSPLSVVPSCQLAPRWHSNQECSGSSPSCSLFPQEVTRSQNSSSLSCRIAVPAIDKYSSQH